jgi:molybdopterin-guanine dinucleotide biosynthesis protein A
LLENSEYSDPGGATGLSPTAGCAGILLTGGASRRMGRDKAGIEVPGDGGPVTLAERTARILGAVAAPVVEVGPARGRRWAVREDPPGSGPLAAVAAGWTALEARGWTGAVLVVATDLPLLSPGLLRWLAAHDAERAVVPVAGGRVQPLCARYRASDLAAARDLVGAGRRAMSDLIGALDPVLIPEAEWSGPAGGTSVLEDVDTPADLTRVAGRS